MKKVIFICFFLGNTVLSLSQNLVPNPSFEQYSACPFGMSQIDFAVPWYQQNYSSGSSDYYNACSSWVGVPDHGPTSHQYARTGVAYAGIEVFQLPGNAREYINVKLNSSLIAGRKYCGSFFVNFDDSMKYGIKEIGMYFSPDSNRCHCSFINVVPQVEYNGNPILDTLNWIEVSGEFIAVGGEQYITIGNFRPNSSTTLDSNSTGWPIAYYNIDDVSVIYCDATDTTSTIFIPSAFSPNEDGQNDILFIRSNKTVRELRFSIYDRWGETVFETQDINEGWDGTYGGKKMNSGVFVYFASGTYTDGKSFSVKGDVSLVR